MGEDIMMMLLGSCSTLVATGLLAAAAWMYITGREKPEAERNQSLMIGLAGLGIFACLISLAVVALYIVNFMLFSS
jgi:hypothetical protein